MSLGVSLYRPCSYVQAQAAYSENGVSDKGNLMQFANPSHKVGHSFAVALVCFMLGFAAAHMVSARNANVQTDKILVTSRSVVGEVIRYPHSGPHPRGDVLRSQRRSSP